MKTLYDRLKPEVKEKVFSEYYIINYPLNTKEVENELKNNVSILDLRYQNVYWIFNVCASTKDGTKELISFDPKISEIYELFNLKES